MNHRINASLAALVLCFTGIANATAGSATLTATEAAGHIGEAATVCGVVVSPKFLARSRGQPTFLNLDKPYS